MIYNPVTQTVRRKAVWGPKRTVVAAAILVFGFSGAAFAKGGSHATSTPGSPNAAALAHHHKLDDELQKRASTGSPTATTQVIVTLQPGATVPPEFKKFVKANGALSIINGAVLTVPNGVLKQLEKHPDIFDVHFDRPISKSNYLTGMTTGSRAVNAFGLTGAGIGVAVIDSGVAQWHDDLTVRNGQQFPYGNQRVSAFVDFVNGRTLPYDDEGHGTHVAGIIAGNGKDSSGLRAGVAPDASLAVLKVLDANGAGTISNIISALNWVLTNRTKYNIRVVNLSVGARVTESYWSDPLALAAKHVVDAGVVVVAAAGNHGTNTLGQAQYGAISAPGNAPWVLTVGASSTQGTPTRSDDVMGSYSSRGPTYIDYAAKPDLVAPGTGTVSLSDPWGTIYALRPTALLSGSLLSLTKPYLSLTGTSMAAPVVSGAVVLMLQANPSLTPNAVKALLQFTAETRSGYNALTQGAGFLNTLGAVALAKFYAIAGPGAKPPLDPLWSKKIIWGNHRLSGGALNPASNAFKVGTTWGVAKTDSGDNIVWGTMMDGDNIVWGTMMDGDNIVWGTSLDGDNIVWGTSCGGGDCDNIVWGTYDAGDNIVWGTADLGDNIVWGTASLGDNIVWGTDSGDNIVWGTDNGSSVLWNDTDPSVLSAPTDPALSDDQLNSLLSGTTTTVSNGGLF